MNIHQTTTRLWTSAVDFATTVRAELAQGVTVTKWKRPPRHCPPWCAKGHYCSAQHGYPSGQHRSEPASWNLAYGRLIATRVAAVDGANRLELRAVINLPGDDESAGQTAQQLLTAVHVALTALSAVPKPLPSARVADRQLTGGTR